MNKTYEYQIEEEYKGEKIVINVLERYHKGTIYDSLVNLPGDLILRGVCGIPDNIILRKLEIHEKDICKSCGTKYYKPEKRLLKFIYNYCGCRYVLYLYINSVDRKVYFIDINRKNVLTMSTLDNGEYRKIIRSDIYKFEQFVDDYYDKLMIESGYLDENLGLSI